VFDAEVRSHGRRPDQVYFGINPIGGSSAGAAFRGVLEGPAGGKVNGGPEAYFGLRRLAAAWWERGLPGIGMVLLGAALAGGLAAAAVDRMLRVDVAALRMRAWRRRTRAPHGTFLLTLAACGVGFAWVVTQGTMVFRYPDSFGSFYDHQAASMLQGRLDVPEAAISGEAFVVGGKYYGYFGVTPSVLRLPLAAAGWAQGEVTRAYLLGYFLLALAAAYALLCLGVRRVAGAGAWPSRMAVVLLIGGSGLGSTFLFLGARAYVYHEAILAGAAFALATTVAVLRWVATGRRAWAAAALLMGVATLHARPTTGLFALGLVGVAALWRAWQGRRSQSWREPLMWAAGAGLGVLTFNGMSYLKFGTFDGSPFKYSVQYTPERRARFENRNFHLSNLRHNAATYFGSADLHVGPRFPYLRMAGQGPGGFYPEARIDLEEASLAVPFAMPALFLLATLGAAWAALVAPGLRVPLGLLAAAVAPMTLALLTAIVTSHRYTGDFCPWLIASGALGLAALDTEAARWRRAVLAVTAVLTTWAIVLTLALALHFQGDTVWGVPEETKLRYQRMREQADRLFGVAKP
jgi:hypothetical protein